MMIDHSYRLEEREGKLYVCLEGSLDEKNFMSVSRALADRTLMQPVVVDLKDVQYADSSGLRALVLLQRQAREAGVSFELRNLSDAVRIVFQTTGLDRLFNIDPLMPDPLC